MKEKQVRELLEKNNLSWESFQKYMVGQTVSSDKNGETIYWEDDVMRFVRSKGIGIERYFD